MVSPIKCSLDNPLKQIIPSACFAWAHYQGVKVTPPSRIIDSFMEQEQYRVKVELSLETLTQDQGVACAREAFKALGLDPARYRPSQEALLRRVLMDKPIPQINSAVDVNNLLSIRYRVALGLYDADKIEGNVVIRAGKKSDVYTALNGRDVDCENKLILVDQKGPIGSPYVDSIRTSVGEMCQRFFHVVYVYPARFHQKAFESMADILIQFHGGTTDGYQFS
jgi:DNA/RNA-binding domain of Phe-tRNA-synthetase-like protein